MNNPSLNNEYLHRVLSTGVVILSFMFLCIEAPSQTRKTPDPFNEFDRLDNLIDKNDGEVRAEAIASMWDLHQRLLKVYLEEDAGFRPCTALFQTAIKLEHVATLGEAPEGMEIFDVLENGRKAVSILRPLVNTSEMAEVVKQNWFIWIDKKESVLLWQYARWLRDAYRIDEAKAMLDRAESLNQTFILPWIHLRYASVHGMSGNFQQQWNRLEKARIEKEKTEKIEDEKEIDDEEEIEKREKFRVEFQAELAFESYLHFLAIGVPEQAARQLQKGKSKSETMPSPSIYQDLAAIMEVEFLITLDQYESAIIMADRLLAEKKVHSPANVKILETRFALAKAEQVRRQKVLQQGDTSGFEDARRILEKALEPETELPAFEQFFAALTLARIELDEGRWEKAARWMEKADATGVLDESGKMRIGGCSRSAYHAALKARLLIESGAESDVLRVMLERLSEEHRALIDQLASIPARKGGVGFLYFDERRMCVAELIRLRLKAEGKDRGTISAFDDLMLAQSLGSLARALDVRRVDLEEIRGRLLGTGRGILAYLPAPDRSYVFALDTNGIRVVELPSEQILQKARKQFERALWSSHADPKDHAAMQAPGQRLADLLMPPEILEKVEAWDELILTGLDLLGWTPFECLPLSSGRPAGLEKAITWLPSLSFGVHLANLTTVPSPFVKTHPSGRPEILMLIAPEPGEKGMKLDPEATPIHLSKERLRALERSLKGRRAEMKSGSEATEELLMSSTLDNVRCLCILAHGVIRKNSAQGGDSELPEIIERPATLLLSPSRDHDGIFSSDEIEPLNSPSIVILSACSAAKGPVRYGDDGINHLGGAFLQAGTETVLLTNAQMEVDSTAELTAAFMTNLVQRGLPAAHALRQARCQVAAQPERSHPYFHSLQRVVGLGFEPVFEANPDFVVEAKEKHPAEGNGVSRFAWPGALLLMVLLFLFLLRRKNSSS